MKSANALIQAQKNSKLSDQIAEKYLDGALLSRLLPTLAHFGFSLKAYQETMLPFAQRLHDSEDRARADYARIFDSYFPKEPTFEDTGGWMSMANVTMQYLTMEHPGGDLPVLVTRSHYVSFVGMLRGDFFEALRAGHGVRRCFHCNQWFLTTNAHSVKYCDGLAPGDPKGRTCRAVGAKNGYKEDAKAHPIKGPYVTRRNTISKYVSDGAMSKELGAIALRLTEEKRTRAFTDHDYFLNCYAKEMSQKAIVTEFDDLGAHFELTTAGGAEKAYRKTVDHLTRLLVEDNAIDTVTIKRKNVIRRKKKYGLWAFLSKRQQYKNPHSQSSYKERNNCGDSMLHS